MRVDGTHYRSIWFNQATAEVGIIDQRWLPNEFRTAALKTRDQFATAIRDMWVRGAPLIGATAAYGVAMEMANDPSDRALDDVWHVLNETRPTAINLRWALDRCRNHLVQLTPDARPAAALQLAHDIAEEDVETNRMLGVHGLSLINDIAAASHRASRFAFSHIVMLDGLPRLIGALRQVQSITPLMQALTSMFMLMKHGHAIKVGSRPGS